MTKCKTCQRALWSPEYRDHKGQCGACHLKETMKGNLNYDNARPVRQAERRNDIQR